MGQTYYGFAETEFISPAIVKNYVVNQVPLLMLLVPRNGKEKWGYYLLWNLL